MTIANEVNKSGPYFYNGATTNFAYGFKIDAETHIRVVETVVATGLETDLTLNSDYTVTGVGSDTGNVVITPARASGKSVTLVRNVPFTQPVVLENQGAYFAKVVEAALDRGVARDQQLQEQISRAVVVPISADGTDLEELIEGVVALLDNVDAVVTVAGISEAVETAADIAADIVTVAGIAPAVSTVAALAASLIKLERSPWINGNMDIWQKGPTMPVYAAVGGYQCDFNGHRGRGSEVLVERRSFPLGQTDVPGNPKYFMRTNVSSVAGADNYAVVAVDIDDVQTYAGGKATVAFWAKADGNKPVSVVADQHFGAGGSPSALVTLPAQKINLTTSWQRFNLTFTFPTVAGKTLGTSDTDTPRIGFIIYLDAGSNRNAETSTLGQQNIVFDLARVSVHADPSQLVQYIADPYNRSIADDWTDCLSLLRILGAEETIWSGYVETAKRRWWGVNFGIPMKRTPVATATKTASLGFDGALEVGVVTKTGVQLTSLGTATLNTGYIQGSVILDANHPYTP